MPEIDICPECRDHCDWDDEYKVWFAKKDLGSKLSKFKITEGDL